MRAAVGRVLEHLYQRRPFIFMTGDLGYGALEGLRQRMGRHFINAGVAEQNMISVAAGIARAGMQVWCYSIAPFLYARPFEQIRNDVAMSGLDVKLIGNGGGYGYGVMGPTHHALEDYGVLLTLNGLRVYIPVFADDLEAVCGRMASYAGPSYVRLGRCEKPAGLVAPPYEPWRRILDGKTGVILAVGPLVSAIAAELLSIDSRNRPALWAVSELPFSGVDLPAEFVQDITLTGSLVAAEEHVRHGGVGQLIAEALVERGACPPSFVHRPALGYPSQRYGSQGFHRKECGLDPASLIRCAAGKGI